MEKDTTATLLYIHARAKTYTEAYILGMIDMAFLAGLIGIDKKTELIEIYCRRFAKFHK